MNEEYRYILMSFLPEIMLVGLALIVLAVDLLLPKRNTRRALVIVAALGCLGVAGAGAWQWVTASTTVPRCVQTEVQALAKREQAIDNTIEPGHPFRVRNAEVVVATTHMPDGKMARDIVISYRQTRATHPEMPDAPLGLAHPGVSVWWLFANDRFADAFKVIFALAAFLVLWLSTRFPVEQYRAEFAALLLFATVGLMVMVNSMDLVVLFLGLELASLCLYALAAWRKKDPRSAEAGMKYLLLGSLASAFFIYGASLFFAQCGTTHLSLLCAQFAPAHASLLAPAVNHVTPLVIAAFLMLLTGFGFKIAAAPFHAWAPDVYQGAPVAVAAFLSTASKAAGFAVLLRVLVMGFFGLTAQWWALIAVLAALSMMVGNLVAVHQNNVKRMLAYSGIAQAGYVLIGVMAIGLAHLRQSTLTPWGLTAAILYLFLYTVGNIGAFAITGIVERETGSAEMSAFAGLRWRAPVLAFGMALLLLSLGGIPLLSGFVGKWFLFLSGVTEGQYWLVLLGAALSVVSIYYYLLVIKQMYIIPAKEEAKPIRAGAIATVGLFAIVALTVLIGIYPQPFLTAAQLTARSLMGW